MLSGSLLAGNPLIVIAGLEPAIQKMPETAGFPERSLDCRDKPGNESVAVASGAELDGVAAMLRAILCLGGRRSPEQRRAASSMDTVTEYWIDDVRASRRPLKRPPQHEDDSLCQIE